MVSQVDSTHIPILIKAIYSAWSGGYYDDLISFMRNLLSNALKDNAHLEKSALTGILRIAKEIMQSRVNKGVQATDYRLMGVSR